MKKSLLLVAFISLIATSCKKERTCTCTTTTTSSAGGAATTTVDIDTREKDTKKNFKRDYNCFDRKETQTVGAITITNDIKCELK